MLLQHKQRMFKSLDATQVNEVVNKETERVLEIIFKLILIMNCSDSDTKLSLLIYIFFILVKHHIVKS